MKCIYNRIKQLVFLNGMIIAVPLLSSAVDPIPWEPVNDYVLNPLEIRAGDTLTGEMITTVAEWEAYRESLVEYAAKNAFGRAPAPDTYTQENVITGTRSLQDGTVILKTVNITIDGPNGSYDWEVKVWLPVAHAPVKVILFVDHRGSFWGDESSSSYFDLDLILSRGYGAAYYSVNSVAPGAGGGKSSSTYKEALHNKFNLNGRNDWGLIATWAFGGLRVVDALLDKNILPDIDEVAVAGHSRSGHTAEWMASQDTRIKYCISNGATDLFAFTGDPAADKQDLGWKTFWYCGYFSNYYKANWPEVPWPEDGNIGIALIAPRLFALGSGQNDKLVAKRYLPSEYYACVYSQPVWNLYGLLDEVWTKEQYSPQAPIIRRNGNLQYHMATHGHGLETWDWMRYLDFADDKWVSSPLSGN